jgi:hypothetical protein
LREYGSDALFETARPRPVPGAQLLQRGPPASLDPATIDVEFGDEAPWVGTRINRDVRELLRLCDGQRTGEDLWREVQARDGLPERDARQFVTEALEALAAHGIVELARED